MIIATHVTNMGELLKPIRKRQTTQQKNGKDMNKYLTEDKIQKTDKYM